MGKTIRILNMALFPSDGSRHIVPAPFTEEVMLHFSKGPVLGRYPKFDLWVFKSGQVLYKEGYGGGKNPEIEGVLPSKIIHKLGMLLKGDISRSKHSIFTKDLPLATLKFQGKEFEYCDATVEGPLKTIDMQLEWILTVLQYSSKLA